MTTVREQLAALNTRPATLTILDADDREISRAEYPNRAAAKAAPIPDGCTRQISVYMLDLLS